MSTYAQIALGVGIALIILASVLAARRGEPRPVTEISPAALAEARRLVADGKKVQAIKAIRDDTGMALTDAKDYADFLETGEQPARQPVHGVSAQTLAQAQALVAAGKPVMAVKAVRDETGWSLQQCKEVVDRLRQNPGS